MVGSRTVSDCWLDVFECFQHAVLHTTAQGRIDDAIGLYGAIVHMDAEHDISMHGVRTISGLPSSLFMNLFCSQAFSIDPRSQYCTLTMPCEFAQPIK